MYLRKILNNNKVQRVILLFLVMFSLFFIQLQFVFLIRISFSLSSLLFTLSFITFITSILLIVNKRIRVILYVLLYLIFYIFLITHVCYYTIMNSYFGISEIFYTGEGMKYFNMIIQIINLKFILLFFVNLVLFILTLIVMKRCNMDNKELNKKTIFVLLVVSLILRIDAFLSLGHYAQINEWIDYSSDRSIYDKWNDRGECSRISGLYEYTSRDIYMLLKDRFSFNKKKTINEINNYFEDNYKNNEENGYSAIFKDKNVIMIQLESIDNWLVTKNNMPTLVNLQNTGLNFINRYAPSMGGGNTYNTEYSVNTGLYIPINGYNIYDSVDNYYPYSLPNLFKNEGYSVNSIHFNQGYFYNRKKMHKTFGYDNHYALMDMGYDYHHVIDDEYLINNDDIYKLIVPDSNKFMSYIVTYSAHVPYIDNELCETHYYKDVVSTDDPHLTCINTLSRITDNFIKRLIERLEVDKKLDNTVLVLFSDHYAYGYETNYIEYIKGGSSKDILECVPLIIWSKDIEKAVIDKYIDSNDILPTLANLFGLDFNPNNYIGTDVFSSYHDDYVYFNDYSWIGSNDDLLETINKKIDVNDNIIKTNYYKK